MHHQVPTSTPAGHCCQRDNECAVQCMYFVDTYHSTISEFRTDEQGVPVKGESGKYERREVVKVPKEDGIPDGMTIDRCNPWDSSMQLAGR